MMFKFNKKEIYIEKAVADVMQKKVKNVMKDKDMLLIFTGFEGVGKTYLASQIGSFLSTITKTKFTIDNIHFNSMDLMRAAESSPKYSVHILDESRSDLLGSNTTSKKNKLFTTWLSESRQLNQIYLLCLPSIHDLDKYISRWRLAGWINVTTRVVKGDEQRGFYTIQAIKRRKQYLRYLDTKYSKIPMTLKVLKGRFSGEFPLDVDEYNKKKAENRRKKFIEIEKKTTEINFGEKELETMFNATTEFRKGFKSGTPEYRTCSRVLKKAIQLKENNSSPRAFNQINKVVQEIPEK